MPNRYCNPAEACVQQEDGLPLRCTFMSERRAQRILTRFPRRHINRAWRLFARADFNGYDRAPAPVRQCFMAFSVVACLDVDRALSASAR